MSARGKIVKENEREKGKETGEERDVVRAKDPRIDPAIGATTIEIVLVHLFPVQTIAGDPLLGTLASIQKTTEMTELILIRELKKQKNSTHPKCPSLVLLANTLSFQIFGCRPAKITRV